VSTVCKNVFERLVLLSLYISRVILVHKEFAVNMWYCTWLSYLLDSSEYKSLAQNARYTFWFNINTWSLMT